MMYMPIWILYWFPFFSPINYGIKFALINIVLWICKKAMNINNVYSISVAIKSLCFNVVAELVGIAIFYVSEMNFETDFYYGNYLVFCLVAFFCAAILNLVLNYIFTFRKIDISTKQKIILTTSIVIATAPYLFLLPGEFGY